MDTFTTPEGVTLTGWRARTAIWDSFFKEARSSGATVAEAGRIAEERCRAL